MQQEPNRSGCKSKTHDICDNAIFASIGGLFSKTLSEKLYTLLKNNARAIDLFLHIPHCYENIYNRSVGLTHNSIGQKVIVPITVQSHVGQVRSSLRYTGRKVYRVITSTNIGETLELMFFNIFPSQIAKLAPGTHHLITGKLESSNLGYKIIHPQIQYDANSKLSAYNKTPLSLNASEDDNMSESLIYKYVQYINYLQNYRKNK